MYLAEYDVEVAQEARIGDPIVGRSFEGIMLNATPRRSLDGKTVAIELDLMLADRTLAEEPFDTGAQFHSPIDKVQEHRAMVNTTVHVPVGGTTVLDAGMDPNAPERRWAVQIGIR